MKQGMKHLMETFFRAITAGGELPIPYEQILLTSRIMEEIFCQLAAQDALGAPKLPSLSPPHGSGARANCVGPVKPLLAGGRLG